MERAIIDILQSSQSLDCRRGLLAALASGVLNHLLFICYCFMLKKEGSIYILHHAFLGDLGILGQFSMLLLFLVLVFATIVFLGGKDGGEMEGMEGLRFRFVSTDPDL